MVGIFTNDIPALPILITDSIRVTISIENNISGSNSHFRVAEGQFTGSDLYKEIEEHPNQTVFNVQNEVGEWTFIPQEKTWIIKNFVLYITAAQLSKFSKDT